MADARLTATLPQGRITLTTERDECMRIRTIAGRLTATALAASLTAVATTASAGSAAAAPLPCWWEPAS